MIDKGRLLDRLLEEIERRKNFWMYGSSIEALYRRQELDELLDFIDTIDVKLSQLPTN